MTLRYAWLVVALLVPVALLNYLDRQMLATMKQSVMRDLPDIQTREQWGFMLGLFKWVYAVLSPFAGYIADRFGRRLTICTSLFVWSAVTMWTGHVTSYNELLLARACMGISEAFYIPAGLALISEYHTGQTRSRAIGIHQMAIYIGQITGGFGGMVADAPQLGWRWAFDACGIVGMLYAIPLVFLLRNAPQRAGHEEATQSSGRDLWELLTSLSFILLVLYFMLPAIAGWVVRDWMPDILQEKFNISQGKAGVSATTYWQVAAIVGALAGGTLADWWMKRHIKGRIFTSAIGMAMIVPAIYGVGNAGSLAMAATFLVLFGLGWGFFDCNNMPILSQIAKPQLRATGYGIMNFVSISFGGFADWGFGKLRDNKVEIGQIFSVFALLAICSIVLVLFIRPNPSLNDQDKQ